jgi:3-hydroxy-9,10-secoandrosta-1,3,5(10)-triene-9,17-dione monooxygenase reductase component
VSALPAADAVRTAIDARRYRDVLGCYPSGITVVTGEDADGLVGFTCQSFSSVSLDPPLVSIGVMRTSTSYPRLRERGRFAINVLGEDQRHLSQRFASKGGDRWEGVPWQPSASGTPLLADSVAWIDCEIFAEHDAGDHLIVLGRVVALGEPTPTAPLLFFRGGYHGLATAAPAPSTSPIEGDRR